MAIIKKDPKYSKYAKCLQNMHNMQNMQYSTSSRAPLVKDGVLYNLGGGTKSTTESLYLRIRQVCIIIEIICFIITNILKAILVLIIFLIIFPILNPNGFQASNRLGSAAKGTWRRKRRIPVSCQCF